MTATISWDILPAVGCELWGVVMCTRATGRPPKHTYLMSIAPTGFKRTWQDAYLGERGTYAWYDLYNTKCCLKLWIGTTAGAMEMRLRDHANVIQRMVPLSGNPQWLKLRDLMDHELQMSCDFESSRLRYITRMDSRVYDHINSAREQWTSARHTVLAGFNQLFLTRQPE